MLSWWVQRPSTRHYFTSLVLNIKENDHWPVFRLFMDLFLTLIAADVWLLWALSLFSSQTWEETHLICICRVTWLGQQVTSNTNFNSQKKLDWSISNTSKTLEVENHITTQSRLHSFSLKVRFDSLHVKPFRPFRKGGFHKCTRSD